jgi:hypothetical protein
VTAATKAATVRPVPQGVESSSDTATGYRSRTRS